LNFEFTEFLFKNSKIQNSESSFISTHHYSKLKYTCAFCEICVFKNLKFSNFTHEISNFLNSKNGMHQVGPNCNFFQNFSSLALKVEAVDAAQNSPYGGGQTGKLFCSKHIFKI
jgi:hypothetical protein